MAIDPSEEGAGYGYATRQNNTCAGDDQGCYRTWGGFRTCCPKASSCTESRTAGVCCPDKEDCTDLFTHNNAHCADEYANLFNVGKKAGLGYFCCSNDTIGFYVEGKGVSCAKDLESAGSNAVGAKLASSATTSTMSITSSTGTGTATGTTTDTASSTATGYFSLPSPTSATTSEDSSSTNTGAIAGGVVGGVAGAAILLVLAWWLLRRRKQQKGYRTPAQATPELGEHSRTFIGELPESKSQTVAELPQSKDQTAAELPAPNNQKSPVELWSGPGPIEPEIDQDDIKRSKA